MNYLLLLFFIIHLAILNVLFISQFLIKKYKYLFYLFCLSAILTTQIILVQQRFKAQKQQSSQAQKQIVPVKQIYLNENINTLNIASVSPKKLSKLQQNLEQALELKPDHRDILFNLGIIALRQQNNDVAAEYFSKSKYQDPNGVLFLSPTIKSLRN